MAIDFKGSPFPKGVILYAVNLYVRYAVSYRGSEEIMAERGVEVDDATLNRSLVKFSPLNAAQAEARKRPTAGSCRVDETYIKVKDAGPTFAGPWIAMAKPLILCCPRDVIWPSPGDSSSRR